MIPREDIDFSRSRAILLGTSKYTAGFEGRRPMPAARASLEEMYGLLTGPCEWPEDRVTKLADEKDSSKLLRTIAAKVRDVEDVLLFYYVGHGLPLPETGRYDLGLALTDTDDDPAQRTLTSLRLRDLREQIDRGSRARIRILILDCCSSGIATKYTEASSNITEYAEFATPLRGAGTYILAACGHAQETYFEEKKGGLTYFTKFLAEAAWEVSGQPVMGATVAHLHAEVRRRLRETSIPNASIPPVPDLHYSGRPDQFLFVRGRARPFRFADLDAGDPREVGGYRLQALLGAGGVGRVFLAHTADGRPIAVKVLKSDLNEDQEFARRFEQEIAIARQVRGNHVAHLVDAGTGPGVPWLASSYVCGPSLHELVRDSGPLPTKDALLIAAGIARGLESIHAVGAVHRDLKPANVMLDVNGPRIIDFGIAKSVAATRITRTHTQLGTPAYKSPEQATGSTVTAASDVFALGSTLYFLAAGHDAFVAEEPMGLAYLIAHKEPDLDVLDAEVRAVVRACLAKEPTERPTPARVVEMCEAVTGPVTPGAYLRIADALPAINARADALRSLTAPPPPPPPGGGPPPPRDPRWPPEPFTEVIHRRSPKSSQQAAWAVVLSVIFLVAAIWLPTHLAHGNSGQGGGSSTTATEPTTDPYTVPYDTDGGLNDTTPADEPTTTEPDTPTDTATPSPTSTLASAEAGDCFANEGTFDRPDLSPADCASASFRAVRVLHDTTDSDECNDAPNVDYRVSADDTVLCLTLQIGSAYHAHPGDCVFGTGGANSWTQQPCRVGNFTLRARLSGTTDHSGCKAYTPFDYYASTRTGWSELDTVLCLAMNYPNAAARAAVGTCLLMTGPANNADFQAVSCPQANVVVTARTRAYADSAFCTGYGWTSWEPRSIPNLAYTVCYRHV